MIQHKATHRFRILEKPIIEVVFERWTLAWALQQMFSLLKGTQVIEKFCDLIKLVGLLKTASYTND